MREIRFRAWDKADKKMWLVEGIKFGDWGWEVMPRNDDGLIEWPNEDHAILMQFTGLKDKNGKDIYEGDIVWTVVGEHTRVQVVMWDRIAYMVNDNYIREFLDASGKAHEVIGNIYENPDLLSHKKE